MTKELLLLLLKWPSKFVSSLGADVSGGAGPSKVRSGGEERSDAVVEEVTTKEDRDLDKVMLRQRPMEVVLKETFARYSSSVGQ